MHCIYCKGPTSVTNSRKQRGGQSIWRRRLCGKCGATFTTIESTDLASSLMVETKKGELLPFSRDILFFSIATSCGHRKNAISEAAALADTVITKLLAQEQAIITTGSLISTTQDTLQHFDAVAATYYKAYFGD